MTEIQRRGTGSSRTPKGRKRLQVKGVKEEKEPKTINGHIENKKNREKRKGEKKKEAIAASFLFMS